MPLGLPALTLAATLQRKAAKAGLDVPSYDLSSAVAEGRWGEALFALVAAARETGADPEAELRAVARAFRDGLSVSGTM